MEIKRERYVDITKDQHSGTKYSLHDAHIQQITIQNEVVTLKFDYIFGYIGDKEYTYKADVLFTGDISGNVYVFDRVAGQGGNQQFSGTFFDLEDFVKAYKQFDFEIITEAYYGYKTILMGQLYLNKNPVTCIMTFWNDGDIIFKIFDEK